ncbi:hypothetical protein [Rhizorhabdus wittichii]|jgi:hypothetical protein|uniref:UrcA family protein n=2 Tax=Rhizorhabdus wittichii TaxID=160791 RepID=A0A9J9HBK1_RHIWR|nr:hypothetical protein [Rhizorhabdus wittichii]ABQ68595.1 hypothetical protein Swit_2236 [Rhizorhabdus wittichii RW1]ARR54527.1 hypothetical protein HY78_14345 [Rhizorhabdus wittichii DC-6]QTH20997.1 hypothetical protein HRJ34_22175 [Rhizorhabdus wittichii]
MRLILSAVSLSLLAASPLAAADLRTTHREVAVPPGKLHARAFRPIAPQPCALARTNPSGSRVAATLPARPADACRAAEAAKAAPTG